MMQLRMMAESSLDAALLAMFAGGYQGAWYDPNDLSTLFQDSAGTTPVTAIGDPVGKMLDKSGNNRHMIQATAAARPILRQNSTTGKLYLECDGIDDSMSCANFNMSNTDDITLAAGIRKESDAAFGVVFELSANTSTNNGVFGLYAPGSAAANMSFGSKGTALSLATKTGIASPYSAHIVVAADISLDNISLSVNDLTAATSASDQGTGNYGTHTAYLFRRGGSSSPFKGRFNGLFVIGRTCTIEELATLKAYYKEKTGT